ncbi:MAG: leucyl aminopeptidase family protein [Rhodospirillales bacterium]|nr:leucyl aminopeptidase family protein [Rhodospirillales bacterium]
MSACLVDPTPDAVPVHAMAKDAYAVWLAGQDARTQAWVAGAGFKGQRGRALLLPGESGALSRVVYVLDDEGLGGPWAWAALQGQLPKGGVFALVDLTSDDAATDAALGFSLADYEFDRYRKPDAEDNGTDKPQLVWPVGADRAYVRAAHGAARLARDLINTPASDMGPAELARAAKDLAQATGASYAEIVGVDLIREGYPAIYAVGRGAEDGRAPRLVELRWGREDAPKVTLVGKGVCFDSGGLDIKSTANMKLMKKDMGGAAHALALASMIMALGLDVRLRVLIAAVENSVSATAMRPLDVVATRLGLSVEIGNTDAEGRVILADALALASEDRPDVVFDFATLTGAARVALGTEVPALFCNDEALAAEILAASGRTCDPLWRLPLWQPYKKQIKSKVADLKNDTDSAYGGAITAALFLEAFVGKDIPWAHVDLMAWNVVSQPGRPEGGEAMGLRAIFAALHSRFGN